MQRKSDMVALFALLPQYPRYYRRNGVEIHGSTTEMGLELTVFPRYWVQHPREYRGNGDCLCMSGTSVLRIQ